MCRFMKTVRQLKKDKEKKTETEIERSKKKKTRKKTNNNINKSNNNRYIEVDSVLRHIRKLRLFLSSCCWCKCRNYSCHEATVPFD